MSMIDENNNQISDIYERTWNNGQLLPTSHTPESDLDGDGWNLAKEAVAGTNPLPGGASINYLQAYIEHVPPVYGDLDEDGIDEIISPETQLITWPTVSGKAYELQVSPSMAVDSWLPLGAARIGIGTDMGKGVPITQGNGETPDRMFFRVAVTDIDEDGDGLESAEEALLGTDPLSEDSDSDGLLDQTEVLAGLNPNNSDTDDDGKDDAQDADPNEWLVDWDKTPEAHYVLIDVETPAGTGAYARDINDKGEVLFDEGIWAAGQWIPKDAPDINGVCQINDEETSYTSNAAGWRQFNDERQLLGSSEINFTSGHAAGGDGLYSAMTWPETQSPGDMSAYVTPFFDEIFSSLHPLGVTSSGTSVALFSYIVDTDPDPVTWNIEEHTKLAVYSGNGTPAELLAPPADAVLMGNSYPDTKVSKEGWMVSQFRKETSTATEYGLAMWNPQHQLVNLPSETAGWSYRANLTKLPNDRMGLVAVRGQNADGLVIMQDNQGTMQPAQTLSGHGIQFMSADGSGITRDNKIWRNGKLKPLRDLCERYGEMVDDGWTFHPLKANSHGIILIAAEGPEGQSETKIAVKLELSSDLNNDGLVGADSDNILRAAALQSGATVEAKETGTEYVFVNDHLSNGLWDIEDPDPKRPASENNDDDAEELKTICGATWGAIWFEHPIIEKLAFYKTKECKNSDKLAFPFELSNNSKLPQKLYVRADDITVQIDGNLVMLFGKIDKSEIWAEDKLKLTVVKEVGNIKFFSAARDYVLENNTRCFAHERVYGSRVFRLISMREESTDVYPIDTFHRENPLYGIDNVVAEYPQSTVAINGNMCFFSDGKQFPTGGDMTDRCHGRVIRRTQAGIDYTVSSDDEVHSPLAGEEAKYIGEFSNQSFLFSLGRVPGLPSHAPIAAMGGLSTNFTSQDRINREYQIVGKWSGKIPLTGVVFTATQTASSGGGPLLLADLQDSGVPVIPGGDAPTVFLLDGGTSTALAHANPDDDLFVISKNLKHTPLLYKINTYLVFRSEKPR